MNRPQASAATPLRDAATSGPEARAAAAPRRLNLGCGQFPLAGFVNVDISAATPADLLCDLDRFPYPFTDRQFEEIRALHVLEHLRDPFRAMAEWHRLLRPGGALLIKVPHFSRGFTHPDHKRGFDVSFPLFFDRRYEPWFTGTSFELERVRLRWNAQPYLKRYFLSRPAVALLRALGFAIDAVANLSPMAFSRLGCFWVGGFEEIEFSFVRPPAE